MWRENASKVNANVAKIKEELKGYKFDDKDLEFENINAAHNVIAVKLPKDFLRYLNEKGYEFKPDSEQYVRIQVPYTLRDDEVSKFFSDFREANQEFMNKKPHKEFADKKPSISPIPSDGLSLKSKVMQEIKEFGGVVSKEFKELAELFKSSDKGR